MENHHTDTNTPSPQPADTVAAASACSENRSEKAKQKQQRTCIVTREECDKAELLRFVCNPSGQLYFDLNHKLPGRGLYVQPTAEALQQAVSKKIFAKAAKRQISIPDDLLEQVETQMRRSALNMISLARRAGDLIISAEKINKYIKNNKIACYITSSSQGTDLRREIEGHIGSIPVITEFSNAELSEALGLENAVHLALKDGNIVEKFLKQLDALESISATSAQNRK